MKTQRSVVYKNRTLLHLVLALLSYVVLVTSLLMLLADKSSGVIAALYIAVCVGAMGQAGIRGMIRDVKARRTYQKRVEA